MTMWSVDYASISNKSRLDDPIGFESGALLRTAKQGNKSVRQPRAQEESEDVKVKINRAWDVAISPAKSIPMNAIMIYMSGNGVQIFSVMITVMLFFQPVKAIMSLGQTFERFESKGAARSLPGANLFVPKLAFLGLQIITMLLGVYKINSMGLLPTTTSDWLAFLPPKEVVEYGA